MGWPCTRLGWRNYYAKRFNKTRSQQAEQLACWYLLLYLEFGMAKLKKPDTWFCISHEFRLAKYIKAYTVEEAAESLRRSAKA